ncbi:MAG TPA: serine hydrolase domain-containing protein [Candidatus Polarisedimenticolia bacterium]|nr:serine hydrolase domain-containing protein [Candidatus Polarisedimenticolia bacterium]
MRLRTTRAILAILAFASVPSLAGHEPRLAPEKRKQIEAAVTRYQSASRAPGLSVAVVENGAFEWSSGFGMADLENAVPASSQTLYRLGSISKPLTATAAALLWQRHKLDLDAPVQNYCPSFPRKDDVITTRQVLGHLGGIRHYKSDSQDDLEIGNTRHSDDTVQSGLKFFAEDPLVAKPGTEYHYSTQGYTLVACVIEGASGEKYVDFVRRNVLQPAGMTHTTTDDRFAIIPHRTRFYERDPSGNVVNADFLDSSYKVAGGGWLSSAEDMAAFAVAMLQDRVVQPPTRELMWTSLKTGDGKPTGYGLGWSVKEDLGVPSVSHNGGQQGTSTSLLMVPDRKAAVVVLVNLEGAAASTLAADIMKVLLGLGTTTAK